MRRNRFAAALVAMALVAGACSSDDDPAAGDDVPTDDGTGTDDGSGTDDGAAAGGETITVTAINYGYTGVPETMAAGTTVVMQNDSEDEVHEILAFRLPDDETRPVSELVQLPQDELEPILGGPPIVALAPPGADSTATPTPPAVFADPGRYALVCFLPTGGPPDEVMAAVQAYVEGGSVDPAGPEYPETGPPHAVNGMFAEVTVE